MNKIKRRKYGIINIIGHHPHVHFIHRCLKNEPVVHSQHEVYEHYENQFINYPLLQYLFKRKIPIIVHSQISYDKITVYPNCDKSLIHFIPFGIFESYSIFKSDEEFINNQLKQVKDFILFYGFISEYKGLDILYKAGKLLNHELSDHKIVVAGNGADPVMSEIKKDKNYIVINRHLSNMEIVSLIERAKFIVCPYKSASQSGITVTSFVFDKPVIASSTGAFTELINHEENGLLIPVNSHVELADAIKRLFRDQNLYTKLREGIKEFKQEQNIYNWNSISQKTLELYLKYSRKKK